MQAFQLQQLRQPLQRVTCDIPEPAPGEVLLKVHACGVCRTDLHLVQGELGQPNLPIVPGHQIVGTVCSVGEAVTHLSVGSRVGVPWLAETCGDCEFCLHNQENLCNDARFTGFHRDGGFAEFCLANAQFCLPVPEAYSAVQAAPLLCAGLIGYRAYQKTGAAKILGFYGFGASAHLLTQLALAEQKTIYAFTRPGDEHAQTLARELGVAWAGNANEAPPTQMDAAIIFAPIGDLVPLSLSHLKKGGVVVTAGIHMSDIPSFAYELLWQERTLCSVANLTRQDGMEFLELAPHVPIEARITCYPLAKVNDALADLANGRISGAAVITV